MHIPMTMMMMIIILTIVGIVNVSGFSVIRQDVGGIKNRRSTTAARMAASVGIFFGTSTGNTESVAYTIAQEFGTEYVSSPPIDIDSIQGSLADIFAKYNAIIVGTPTWNTGADTQRSGTGWDEVYYTELSKLSNVLTNKKVAVFGLGDSISYGSNYADGMGELHDVFQSLGCTMMGYVSQDGYEHEASKAIRGEYFCGLPLDNVNFEELTPERIQKWVQQLKDEGMVSSSTSSTTSSSSTTTTTTTSSIDVSNWDVELEESSKLFQSTLKEEVNIPTTAGLIQPHYNAVTGRTMWTSKDGRKCYYTTASNKASP